MREKIDLKLHSFLSPVRNFRKINFLSRIETIPCEIPSSSLEKLLKRQTFSITIIIALSSYITVTNCLVPCCSLLSSPSSSSSPVVFCPMWSCRLWCTRFQCTILYVSSHQSYSHIHILHMYAEQVPTIIYSVYTVINYMCTHSRCSHIGNILGEQAWDEKCFFLRHNCWITFTHLQQQCVYDVAQYVVLADECRSSIK